MHQFNGWERHNAVEQGGFRGRSEPPKAVALNKGHRLRLKGDLCQKFMMDSRNGMMGNLQEHFRI
jgi:hypothetical protein